MKYVFVSGPFTRGVPAHNVHDTLQIAESLVARGFVPYIPHLSLLWDVVVPHSYEFYMAQDFAWIDRCDALLRIPGESPGGDREVMHAKANGIPVFFSLEDLLQAARPEAIHGYR